MGEQDSEDNRKKEEREESKPPSYESLEVQSITSVGDKKKTSDHVDTNGIIHVKEEEKSKVENEKTGESGDKKEDSKKEEDEKEKSPDPPPVGLIELVDFDLLSIKP